MKTYVIVPIKDLTHSQISESLNGTETIRMSLDGTLAVLKFTAKYPDGAAGYEKYDQDAILEILTGPAWTSAE